MDWIRRNWPDLLIGFALLAVISGIVATLLTGGSIFPLGGSGTSAPRTEPQTVQTPRQVPPGTAEDEASGLTGEPGDATGIGELPLLPQAAPGDDADQGDPASVPDGPVDPLAQPVGGVVAVRPGDTGQAQGQVTPAAPPASQQPAATPDPTPAPTPQPTAPQSTTPTSPPASADGPTAQVPYTVAVGAFRNAENAERQASVFRQAGYSVLVAAQDDLNVVLLGPYAAETEAARVRDAVATGGFDVQPIVYTYQDDDGGTSVAAPSASTEPAAQPAPAPQPAAPAVQPVSEPVSEPTAPQPAATPDTPAPGRFLQVGAYGSQENAAAQEQALGGLGYAVTRQQDGNLIRILVGPYAEGELTAARDRLAAQGIEAIPR
mgnify:CR=1 FL=1